MGNSSRDTDFANDSDSFPLLLSLLSSSDAESEGAADFCECVKTLADKVGLLAKAQADLMERCSLIETSKSLLAAELESKLELLKNLYAKHNLDKQVRGYFELLKNLYTKHNFVGKIIFVHCNQ